MSMSVARGRLSMCLLLLGLGACARTRIARVPPNVAPVLPAPRADVYTRAPGTPPDPLVAAVADGMPWDETLSGVAAAVALANVAGESVGMCALRWMGVVAAYPYPVLGWIGADAPHGEAPAHLLDHARGYVKRGGVDIGLVRARKGEVDRWVLVVGEPRGEVPALAREVDPGSEVNLGAGDWRVSRPDGSLATVDGPLRLDAAGEWLLQKRGADGREVATFPLFVGVRTPLASPLACTAGEGAPTERLADGIARLRQAYGLEPAARDTGLDSLARARLRDAASGAALPPVQDQLRAVGFLGAVGLAGTCEAATVEACLTAMWWSPEARGPLVGDVAEIGLAVEEAGAGVRAVVVGAG